MNRPPAVPSAADGYDVLSKWDTPSYDDVTREVIARRLAPPPPPRFLPPDLFAVLEAACARLLATRRGDPPIAHFIDDDLQAGRGEGFRRPDMPPLKDTWRKGLRGVDAVARERFGQGFADLPEPRQDEVLSALHSGQVTPEAFGDVPAKAFFVHVLLKAAATHFYGHPAAWNELGYGGPASPRGYVRLELDRRDPWESPKRPLREDAP
jgi:hypothetical protein